jgi:hypothetical protein
MKTHLTIFCLIWLFTLPSTSAAGTLWDWKAGFNYWDSKTNRGLFKAELLE